MVTKDIKSAGYLYEDFIEFLEKTERIDKEEIEKKVLVVTSSPKHAKNVIALKQLMIGIILQNGLFQFRC